MRDSPGERALTPPDSDESIALGELPALPVDFTPQCSDPMPLDEAAFDPDVGPWLDTKRGDLEPSMWFGASKREAFQSVIGPALLGFALLVALGSCVWRQQL